MEGDVAGKAPLNVTNCKKLTRIADGDDDPDSWVGITAIWFCDPDVTDTDGKVTGGFRVRPAKSTKRGGKDGEQPSKKRRGTVDDDLDDEVEELLDDDEE